jgi:hypothetical protein
MPIDKKLVALCHTTKNARVVEMATANSSVTFWPTVFPDHWQLKTECGVYCGVESTHGNYPDCSR